MHKELPPVELFHLGPPKTATTWLYHCLKEHPNISTSRRDAIHYFDIHYALDENWYDEHFVTHSPRVEGNIRFDPTYSYICCPKSIERIAKYNPDAKIVYCLRNPVERAFSHYWHIKKQIGSEKIKFHDIVTHYNNYTTWMEHGLVAPSMQLIKDNFDAKNIHIILYEDQRDKPEEVWQTVCFLAGIDGSFMPSSLKKKVNVAGAKTSLKTRLTNKALRLVMSDEDISERGKKSALIRVLSGKSEYYLGIEKEFENFLYDLIEPDIQDMERISGLNLSHWRPNYEQSGSKSSDAA